MGQGLEALGSSLRSGSIHRAVQSEALSSPISHDAGLLHGEALPRWSQTRTCQAMRCLEWRSGPAYSTWVDCPDSTLPLSHRSRSPARSSRLPAARIWKADWRTARPVDSIRQLSLGRVASMPKGSTLYSHRRSWTCRAGGGTMAPPAVLSGARMSASGTAEEGLPSRIT